MRKFFLGAALVAASFGMAQSADAATVMDVDGVSTVLAISDYEGTYNGTMDQIKMRGEDYEPRAASYTLTILGMDLVTLKLDSLTDAKVTGNTIEFTLAVSGKFLGADFPASVHFVGTK